MAIYHDLDNTGQEVQQRLDQVPVTQADLAEEVLARQAAVGAVQNNVDAEELRAKAAEKLNADDIDAIEEKIPSGASSSNKMATASDISSLDAAIEAILPLIPSGASSSNKMATASDISSLDAAIEAILLLIPSAATSLNKLADKAFVNSSIATATATFRGTKNLVSDLNLAVDATHEQIAVALSEAVSGADNNDYAFVQVPTSSGTPTEIRVTERYKFDGTAWSYEYDLNNSGFTSDQWAAINSTITSGLVDKLNALPSNADLTAALGILTNGIAAINEKIPTAATSSNKLVDTAAMQSYITQILDGIDATFNVTSTDGHVTIQVTQVNGVVTNVAVTTSDIASAADVAQLFQLYNALSQSEPEIIQPADTWPVANPSTTVIYRVIDRVNTPPQNYSDYMFSASDLTTPVLMATYNNAIDPRPKKGSQNLVTSGGVFDNMGALDVSELNATENPHTLATYADLSAALTAIPSDYQKGGMSIKFVQGSVQSNDNNYIQARCMAQNFTTDVTQWQGVDDEPTAGSDNLVRSGGVYGMLQQKVDTSYDLRNILNPDKVVSSSLIRPNGSINSNVAAAYCYCSDYIPFSQAVTVFGLITGTEGGANCSGVVYDSSKNLLRALYSSQNTATFTPVEGDAFIRLNLYLQSGVVSIDNIHANYGTTLNPYAPYNGNPIAGYLAEINEEVSDVNEGLQQKVDASYDMRNILNPEKIVFGSTIKTDGTIRSGLGNSYGYYNDFIELNGQSVTVFGLLFGNEGGANAAFAVYGSNKNFLRVAYASQNQGVFTPIEGDAYIKFNVYLQSNVVTINNIQANYGTTLNPYTPYNGSPIAGYLLDFEESVDSKLLFNADQFHSLFDSVICLGDSMSAGTQGGEMKFPLSYPAFMAKMSNWTVENVSKGGETAAGWWDDFFENYDYTDYNAAIIYLGANQGLTDTLDVDVEPYSDYHDYAHTNTGCYCKIIEGMLAQNPRLKIFLLCGTALNDWSTNNGIVLEKIATKYSLPLFNIKNNPWVDLKKDIYHPDMDGNARDYIHYGTIGYVNLARVVYSYIIQYIKNNQGEFSSYLADLY